MPNNLDITSSQQSRLNLATANGQQLPIAPTNVNTLTVDSNQTAQIQNINNNQNSISNLGQNSIPDTNDIPTPSDPTNSILSSTQSSTASANGISFTPTANPLNVYANYTYHIRWFLLSDADAYNLDESNPNVDNLNMVVIAESGVTAFYNIIDFEIKNTVSNNASTLNTDNISWTMTVVEPYGITLIDKIRAASAGATSRFNYMRAPTFVDIWFTGYNEDGSIVGSKLFYQLYRINVIDMNVDLTEAGSRYAINGVMDGSMGHSNELSFSGALSEITATTVGDFFTKLTTVLNSQQKSQNEQNTALVTYKFNIPPEIQSWPLRNADVLNQNNRNTDMSAKLINGSMAIKINRGMSIENVVNYVLSMSPNADKWIKGTTQSGLIGGADLSTTGLATWLNVYSSTRILAPSSYTNDYTREVTFSLVPFKTIKASGDKSTISKLISKTVQQAKINYLSSVNTRALTRLYQYIYTGENTEVIKFDVHVNGLWNIVLPQWEATNTYSNYTVGPQLDANSVGTKKILNQYTKQQQIQSLQNSIQNLDNQLSSNPNSPAVTSALLEQSGAAKQSLANVTNPQTNTTSNDPTIAAFISRANTNQTQTVSPTSAAMQSKAASYVEDIQISSLDDVDVMPITLMPEKEPSAQVAEQGGDSNRAKATTSVATLPDGRSFIGAILGNIYDNDQFFMKISLEIRGDPYWMGQGNVRANNIAKTFGQDNGDTNFANFIVNDNMFVLNFRSGSNYDESTGLMQFNTTNEFFNGAYGVSMVTNTFRNGNFTQTLDAYKDPMAQKVTNDLVSSATTMPSSNTMGPR